MPIRKKGKHQRHADQRAVTRKKRKSENPVPDQINLFTFKIIEG